MIRLRVLASLLLILLFSHILAGQQAKKPLPQPPDGSSAFTPETAVKLMDQMLHGLQSHNQSQFLSAFDPEFMTNYGQFSGQIEALFTQYDNFSGRYHVRQAGDNPDHPLVLVQFDLEASPVVAGAPLRKSAQVRFEFGRGKRGWKIVNLTPRGFFS